MKLRHRFVGYIPGDIEERTLYISVRYGTVIHKCVCGCGEEVVTPLGPTEWKFTYDGETISLQPSVGNWSFRCRSHYVIKYSCVQWARSMTMREVLEARSKTREYRRRYHSYNGEIDVDSPNSIDKWQKKARNKLENLWRIIRG